MNIQLWGYYDNNLGDDLMREIAIQNMPEHRFYVNCVQREFLLHLERFENVHINQQSASVQFTLNVIGTGFRYASKSSILSKIRSNLHTSMPPKERMAVVDCSLDFPRNRIEAAVVRHELRKYGYISCRDRISQQMIDRYAPKSIRRMHADLVFALDERRIYPKTQEGCLGVVLVQRSYSAENFSYYQAVAKTCDRYIEETGKPVLLFAFDTGIENDTLAALSVKKQMRHAAQAELIAYHSDSDYILKNYARCDRMISSRFHGVVLAILAGIPVLAVSDRQKIDVLAEELAIGVVRKTGLQADALYHAVMKTEQPIVLTAEKKRDALQHIEELRAYLKGREGS